MTTLIFPFQNIRERIADRLAGRLFSRLAAENRALRRDRREQERLARRDELTGLANRRAFELARAAAENAPVFSFVVLDLNNFKAVNDLCGHSEGDRVLKQFAFVLKKEAAAIGFAERVFRYGGDEAVCIIPNALAMEFRDNVEKAFGDRKIGDVVVSVSGAIGSTFEMADGYLQERKQARKSAQSARSYR